MVYLGGWEGVEIRVFKEEGRRTCKLIIKFDLYKRSIKYRRSTEAQTTTTYGDKGQKALQRRECPMLTLPE